jgi:GH24 family phage-related lysozyme (muramidase)
VIRLSPSGCRFWGQVEGCVLHPYHGIKDLPEVMTIYYGHVIRPEDNIEPPYTQAKAEYWLKRDTAWMQAWLWRHCPWTTGEPNGRQHNFDALCSLVGNAGHVFDDVLAEVNGENRPEVITKLWMSHTRAGKDSQTLAYRRAKEVAFYLTPDPPVFSEDEVREVLNQVAISARKILGEDGFAAG